MLIWAATTGAAAPLPQSQAQSVAVSPGWAGQRELHVLRVVQVLQVLRSGTGEAHR